MTFIKKKYSDKIPTNITTLKIKSNSYSENEASESETTSKSIYLLLEDN